MYMYVRGMPNQPIFEPNYFLFNSFFNKKLFHLICGLKMFVTYRFFVHLFKKNRKMEFLIIINN